MLLISSLLIIRRAPSSTLFPYTTLFRSGVMLLVFLGLGVASLCLVTVGEREFAVVSQFGRPVRVESTPGLKFNLPRSEEHTSELQSRFDIVCRLLLEKKNSIRTRLIFLL